MHLPAFGGGVAPAQPAGFKPFYTVEVPLEAVVGEPGKRGGPFSALLGTVWALGSSSSPSVQSHLLAERAALQVVRLAAAGGGVGAPSLMQALRVSQQHWVLFYSPLWQPPLFSPPQPLTAERRQ